MADKHLKLNPLETSEAIRAKALELGFDTIGFALSDIGPKPGESLKRFINEGRNASMGWMGERMVERSSPTGLWGDVKSVISLGLNYGPHETPNASLNHSDRGTISVYARGRDYHDVMKKRLKKLGRWMGETFGHDLKVFVDTAPVMEKPLAQLAGIGWQGKHTNLVSREFGSWLFLGEIFTTLELAPDKPEIDHCGNCTACIDACPTGAIEPYRMDARKCISYLTIEHPGEIDVELAAKMGNHIYGCDDCLSACPWNKFSTPNTEAAFSPRAELLEPRLDDLLKLDDGEFRKLFSGSPIKRIRVERMARNVAIAKSNS
ncbi:MAG: tRNA epoxyqueuosine(34) reductase QueG [Rhodospirillaceae bacterium]|nr:tRNA epoxyqueuosine(34) reductase QueG [Rhodospirillaceae bacterium]